MRGKVWVSVIDLVPFWPKRAGIQKIQNGMPKKKKFQSQFRTVPTNSVRNWVVPAKTDEITQFRPERVASTLLSF